MKSRAFLRLSRAKVYRKKQFAVAEINRNLQIDGGKSRKTAEKAAKSKENRNSAKFVQPHGCGNRQSSKMARNSALLPENARKMQKTDTEAKMFGKKRRFAANQAFSRGKTLPCAS